MTLLRQVGVDDRLSGRSVTLRLVTLDDCTPEYAGWLNDPDVSRYLETRWAPQTLESIRAFVARQLEAPGTYLFAILEKGTSKHIGNIKIGPIDPHHLCADVSYFIGDRSAWGRGYATEAIALLVELGFSRLGLHRIQAGVYETNVASRRALEKVGFRQDGVWRRQLRGMNGWEDHVFYGLLREEWR